MYHRLKVTPVGKTQDASTIVAPPFWFTTSAMMRKIVIPIINVVYLIDIRISGGRAVYRDHLRFELQRTQQLVIMPTYRKESRMNLLRLRAAEGHEAHETTRRHEHHALPALIL